MKRGIVTSIAFTVAITGSLFAASLFQPPCDRPAAVDDDREAPAPHHWIIRAAAAPQREGVKVASIQIGGFEIGQIVLTDRPAMNAPEQLASWCAR